MIDFSSIISIIKDHAESNYRNYIENSDIVYCLSQKVIMLVMIESKFCRDGRLL